MPQREHIEVEGRELAISNLEKIFFPATSFTKGELIAFYSAIADTILPHLRERPLTLKRYPDGVTGKHFYEKNAPVHTPSWVKRFAVPRSEGGSAIHYVLCNDRATLVWVTNLADIEKHVLLARAPELNRPTSLVFDLDPGEHADILDCGRVALHLKKLFDSLDLQSLVKVSGSKGLHLAVPLNSEVNYEMTQPFAKALAELVARQLPERVVSEMSKTLRRGKVLIDWSQNSDFKTTVSVYAMRARPEGPFISMPITWEELAKAIKRGDSKSLFFRPDVAVKRIERVGDLFEPMLTLKQELPLAFTEALAAGPPPRLSSWPRNRNKGQDRSLREYAAKRDHSRTPEPAAGASRKSVEHKAAQRFVIQKHQASHLHYDWRLEMEGVLRSWAVPKGPPAKLREARLAMHVEDHPLEYADFEGTIPTGNYGAGTVMVWDQGEYEDITGNASRAYHSGKMHLRMRGRKLQGEWILVKDKREEESNKWLLIKAGEELAPLSAKDDDTSVLSGRSMRAISKANDAQWESNRPAARTKKTGRPAGKRAEPKFIEPMQCKPVAALPSDEPWIFEIKFDGYRCIAVKLGSEVTLFSRNQRVLNERFPKIVDALASLDGDFVLDGELVAFDPQEKPSFQLLQNDQSPTLPVYFYAFDLLNRDSESLLSWPIERRCQSLDDLLRARKDPLRLSQRLQAPSGHILEAVRKLGLEGVIAKRINSHYEPGDRSGAWVKHRLNRAQEFVIGGYVPGARGFDALLVGIYENKHLLFVAKVKNGFVAGLRDKIFSLLEKRRVTHCPFKNLPEKKGSRRGESLTAENMKRCRWIKPELVCEVEFVEWTDAGHLRHSTFIAMRDDKEPAEVIRET